MPADGWVLDGELVIPQADRLSFGALQDRIHPAASRIARLAASTPALLVVFDCLASAATGPLLEAPLRRRRQALQTLIADLGAEHRIRQSPGTSDPVTARAWLSQAREGLDGVIAKRLDGPYLPGKRDMLKLKRRRTAECVVGGFRYARATRQVGSLLLGLYNAAGRLDHVGFSSGISDADRPALTARLEALRGGEGFSGEAPGGPSRWRTEGSDAWERLQPQLVVEVGYDQVTDGRFRHGTALLRWRPDKAPRQCTTAQLIEEQAALLALET